MLFNSVAARCYVNYVLLDFGDKYSYLYQIDRVYGENDWDGGTSKLTRS